MKRTMTKRFYKTSSAVNYPQLLGTYSEALSSATNDLNENEDKNEVYIVEVVAVVRRERTPIVVEEIRRER